MAEAVHADKVDAFLYDETKDRLVALGTSTQPLSSLQQKLGLDILPVSNGGRVVQVYRTGKAYLSGRVDDDADELRGVKEALKVKSQVGVPLEVGGGRRGVLMAASLQRDFFGPADVQFAESVGRWVAMLAHRAELVEQITRNAVEEGRRSVAQELITVLAHDLRNYLSPIRARLQLLRARAERDARGDDVRETDTAIGAVERLSRLISDLLDVAKLDQGIFRLDVQPVDLQALVAEVARMFSTGEMQVTLAASERPIVAGDIDRIHQCVENLVANAVQHSPRGAAVTLLLHNERRDDRVWGCLEVQNEGPGIPVDVMPRLFQRFAPGPASRGLGLGLYLAQRIAVAHGGELTAESSAGKGARFVLRLPAYK